MHLEDKINAIATKIYGAKGVEYARPLPKCLLNSNRWDTESFRYVWPRHSTHYRTIRHFLEDRRDLALKVREVYVSAGAGFVVALTGSIMTMPGLPKSPAAERVDYDENTGKITGLF